jgi:outer membrane immunogenic protein
MGTASAADLAAQPYTKAPPVAVEPVFNWTGFYVGVNGGYGWGRDTADFTPNDLASASFFTSPPPSTAPGPGSIHPTGGFGGLQAGYNWQIGQFVTGVEADFDGARIRGSAASPFLIGVNLLGGLPGGATMTADQNVRWFGTVRGRIGYTAAPNLLLFATGGFAYADVNQGGSIAIAGGLAVTSDSAFNCHPGVQCFGGDSSHTATGGTVGGGAEYAVSNNISLKAEYLFMGLKGASTRITAFDGLGSPPSSVNVNYGRLNLNTVRVGLNYKFGGPVVARY